MSREWLPAALRRLILQSVWGWALVAVGVGAGEPVPQRASSARQAASVRDVIRLRDPTGSLTVDFEHPRLICDPQEVVLATVSLDLVDSREANGRPAKPYLKWKLLAAGTSRPVAAGTAPVTWPADENGPADVPLELAMPREEGVYELRLTAGARRHSDVEFVIPLLVFDAAHPGSVSAPAGPEKLVDSFVPATSTFRKVALDRSQTKLDQSWSRFWKLPRHRDEAPGRLPAADTGATNAVAYRLKVTHPGRPHRIELVLPGTGDQRAICRLMEADGRGNFAPLGPQAAVSHAAGHSDVSGGRSGLSTEPCIYQQIFWPNDREPVVLIAGAPTDQPIEVSRVELYEMGERLPAPRAAAFDHTSLEWKQRLAGLHLSSLGLIRNFGGPQVLNAKEKRFVDDWQSCWTAARRLTDYLRYQRHNALLLSVPTANDDSPAQTDLVELLLRLFDREDLVLVPELAFNQPLPAIEDLLRNSTESNGTGAIGDLLLVNAAGQTRAEVDEGLPDNDPGHSPYYNILSPRVQAAVLDVTREFVERYSSHASLGGIAFELGLDSFLQLPGIEWGYDPETIRHFEQATRLQVPRASRPEAQQQAAYRYLTTTARREWIRYRCGEVARLHRQLAELVLAAKPDAQVFFSGRLWHDAGAGPEGAVLDFVRSGGSPAHLLNAQGLDFSQAPYATDARITVLRPFLQLSSHERLAQAAATTLNHSPAIDALYRIVSPGGLLYSPAVETHRAQPEVDTNGASEQGPHSETLRPIDVQAVCGHYAHLVATLDAQAVFDGSAAFPLAPADATQRMRTIIASLPSLVFRAAGPQPQPLAVRAAQHGNITWIYAVNDSSLPLAIDLLLDCPATTTCRMLDGSRPPVLETISGSQAGVNQAGAARVRLHLDVSGNDLWACRFERAGIAVIDAQLSLSGETLAGVEHRIDRLTARMHSVASLARTGSRQLPNPGFEQQGPRTKVLPGWELPVEQAGWSLDEDNPRSGHKSLAISAEANKTALASPLLALEGNRFITLSLWLRSDKPSARVRIVFEATIEGEPFRREEPVEAGIAWQQHVFRVDPLPTGTMQNARLSVRPVDACKLWVDDVEIGAQSYSSDEVRQLTKTLSSVKLAWEAGRYADCQRLLDGYWGQLLLAEPGATTPTADKPRLGDRPRGKLRR
ncbi:MAG TPA: hypothetical protein VGH74_04920 [Planctomycetaceae bacterium]